MPIQKKRVSPRQKMINLMYLVLMAMLALNVSSDVLNGFSLVSDSLNKSTQNASHVNNDIYKTFEEQMKNNPAKVKQWYDKAQYVRGISDSLFNLAEELKVPLLAQIPIVQSICESGDQGKPAALTSETMTGVAFINLAQAVVTVTNRRNKEMAATKIVGVKS